MDLQDANGLTPLPGHQPTMPPQQRCGRDDAAGHRDAGRSLDRPASAARSAQSSRGRGLVRSRTATSWRSASVSASLEAELRASSASHDYAWTKIQYSSRTATDHRSTNTPNDRSRLATEFSTRTSDEHRDVSDPRDHERMRRRSDWACERRCSARVGAPETRWRSASASSTLACHNGISQSVKILRLSLRYRFAAA